MKILVTGGAGFLGSNLVRELLFQGHEVVVVDNLITGSEENLAEFRNKQGCEFIQQGIEKPEFLDSFLKVSDLKIDQIYHLACPTGVPNIEKLGEEIIDTCSVGTKNVLTVAVEHHARLLFTSSCEVYGEPQITPQDESYSGNVHPQGERANYEEGKRFSESLVAMFVKKYSLPAITVRPFNVYGPKMSLKDQRVVPRFVLQALASKPLTIHGKGEQTRTMCYVADTIYGLVMLMEKGQVGEIYNIGSDQEITMLELAKKVLAVSKSNSKIIFTERFSHDHNARRPNLDKIRTLGWERKIEIEEGLKLTFDYFSQFFNSYLIKQEKIGQ